MFLREQRFKHIAQVGFAAKNGSEDVTKLSGGVTWYACHSLRAVIPLHTLQTLERRQQLLHGTQWCHAQATCNVSRQHEVCDYCQQVQKHAPRIAE